MNLAMNAREAIDPAKGGTVLVRTAAEELTDPLDPLEYGQPALPPGRYVTLEVTDDGSGMTTEVKSRLFEPFFSTKFTGRGLGMAAALGIVRGHRGAITVETELGKGSRFRAYFPAHDAAEPARPARCAHRDLQGRGTVLVVDDEEIVRRFSKSALTRFGYTVLLAGNGKEGVEIFAQRRFEIAVVFVDMTMPVMSGEETLAAIRAIDAAVPLIATSGHNEATALQTFSSYGVNAFIQKPYSSVQVAELVKSVLQGSHVARIGAASPNPSF
jgi:CheY-like chemotaxis protein